MRNTCPSSPAGLIEATARIVAFERGLAVLEPEPGVSCGQCSASASCGVKSLGSPAARLEARRFSLAVPAGLAVGQRVVVGIGERALVAAAGIAYALPLLALLGAGAAAEAAGLADPFVLAASLAGLAGSLPLARRLAIHLSRRDGLAPRFLRRATGAATLNASPLDAASASGVRP